MDRSFTLGSTEEAGNVKILQSCNGLLLCGGSGMPVFDYVYNPSTNQYKKLPYPDYSLDNSPYYSSAGLRIAFDRTKSPHYKLVDAGCTFCDNDIQIYSSETGKWSHCNDHFNYFDFDHFNSAIYWNDGLHWLETKNRQLMHYSLNIEDHDHPIITIIPIPQRGMTFLKYRVHTYDFMTPLLEGWSIRSNVWSIVMGEREQVYTVLVYARDCQRRRLAKKIHDCCNDLRRKNARCRVLIHEMEALGERGVAIDSLESLKQTYARETAKLAALTYVIAESLAGIHEKERYDVHVVDIQGRRQAAHVECNLGYVTVIVFSMNVCLPFVGAWLGWLLSRVDVMVLKPCFGFVKYFMFVSRDRVFGVKEILSDLSASDVVYSSGSRTLLVSETFVDSRSIRDSGTHMVSWTLLVLGTLGVLGTYRVSRTHLVSGLGTLFVLGLRTPLVSGSGTPFVSECKLLNDLLVSNILTNYFK
nr:hypothetical protein [Tanacetum cinerariifolium]